MRGSVRTPWLVGFLFLAAILLLGACGPAATPTPTAIPAPTPTPTPSAVVITDGRGKQFVFTEAPSQIVAIDSATVETLFAMGHGNAVVGTHTFVDYPPEAKALPRVGDAFNLNLEAIAALRPDLVVTITPSNIEPLERLGLRVLFLVPPATLDEVPGRIRTWGRIMHDQPAGEGVASDLERRVQAVRARLSGLPGEPRAFHDLGDLWTAGGDTFIGSLYTAVRARNIAADLSGNQQMSRESIVAADPEVIVSSPRESAEAIRKDPALAGVTAVRSGNVRVVDEGLFSVPGTRMAEALETLADAVHGAAVGGGR